DIRNANDVVVAFSPAMAAADREIKAFLYPHMYRHARVKRTMADAEQVVCDLFARYVAQPQDAPPEWGDRETGDGRLLRIADFIAGMTDRYALTEHARLFASTPELR
ncbi:MAG: deoxyguanosinetriphosphate triphosphohydrolase, partial [Hyphomicrobiales bacterium]|nr:deoxyguanosinetriphosphate triphosphohydrolase [Hyphomicrobiales bacterium]